MESNYNKTQRCPKCGKDISRPNFDIHEAMCKGVRESFILNVNDPEFKEKFSVQEMEKEPEPQVEPPKKPHREPIFEKPKERLVEPKPPAFIPKPAQEMRPPQRVPSSEQKFPCTYCGYMMSMEELDTHPAVCAIHLVDCPYCKTPQPEQFLGDHKQVCQKRPKRQEAPRQQHRPRQQPNQLSPPRRHQQPSHRTNRGLPIRTETMIRYVDGRKIETVTQIYSDGTSSTHQRVNGVPTDLLEEEQDDQDTIWNDRRGGHGMPSFFDFMMGNGRLGGNTDIERMINQLMGQMRINRFENPGLRESDVKALPVVKFNKETNGKKCSNCSICIKDYNEGDVLIKLPCDHLFNKECIYPWLKESAVCPNCRAPVKPSRRRNAQ